MLAGHVGGVVGCEEELRIVGMHVREKSFVDDNNILSHAPGSESADATRRARKARPTHSSSSAQVRPS